MLVFRNDLLSMDDTDSVGMSNLYGRLDTLINESFDKASKQNLIIR